jgi:hypothetical protein
VDWRTKQATTFSARLITLHTQPGLRTILLRAFRSLLSIGDCSFPDAIFSATETTLVDSQTAIGWQHIIFGCFSIEWSNMQESHARAEKLDPKLYSGKSWTAKVTKHIWRAFRALWLLTSTGLPSPRANLRNVHALSLL